jgi:hypothetical protein
MYIIDYLLVLHVYILYIFLFQELVDAPEYVSSGASRFDVKQGELGKYFILGFKNNLFEENVSGFFNILT